MKHFQLLISLLLRHDPQKQGEYLIAGGRKLGESVNKVETRGSHYNERQNGRVV